MMTASKCLERLVELGVEVEMFDEVMAPVVGTGAAVAAEAGAAAEAAVDAGVAAGSTARAAVGAAAGSEEAAEAEAGSEEAAEAGEEADAGTFKEEKGTKRRQLTGHGNAATINKKAKVEGELELLAFKGKRVEEWEKNWREKFEVDQAERKCRRKREEELDRREVPW